MKYLAHYRNPKTDEEYYRTVCADDLTGAMIAAKRFCRKGYRCVQIKSEEY